MDLLNPTPTLRPSAEKVLAETEKGRRTDSPERVNQSIPTVSQPTGSKNSQRIPTGTRNVQIIPTRTGNAQMIHTGTRNSQRIPTDTGNSVINSTGTGNTVINPTGNDPVRSSTGKGNAQQSSKVKNYFMGKKKEVRFAGKCLLPGEKYSSRTEKVKIIDSPEHVKQPNSTGNGNIQSSTERQYSTREMFSEKYCSEQTRFKEYSV